MCSALPLGFDSDTTGNTVGCRSHYATLASSNTFYCTYAGFYGQCGTACEAYCSAMTSSSVGCGSSGSSRVFDPVNALAECTAVCPYLPVNYSYPTTDSYSGNTIQCRLTQAKVAYALNDFSTYCAYASPHGGGVCGNPADIYCSIYSGRCNSLTEYPSSTYCSYVASKLSNGTAYDRSEDSLGCRVYHAVVGSTGGADAYHCNHAGLSGNATCGKDICSTFCDFSSKVCPGYYSSTFECQVECSKWSSPAKLGTPNSNFGDNYYCRLYNLVYAARFPTSISTYCPRTLTNSTYCYTYVPPTTPPPTPFPTEFPTDFPTSVPTPKPFQGQPNSCNRYPCTVSFSSDNCENSDEVCCNGVCYIKSTLSPPILKDG